MSLSGPLRAPLSKQPAKQLIVLLHGWGADGANLIDIADMLAPALPDAHFVSPNAPELCEANPYGYQWFSLNDRAPAKLLSGVRSAADNLNKYLDETLKSLNIAPEKLALVGFSQGTMLALHAGLRRTPNPACIVGFSGALIGPEALPREMTGKTPTCLIHGEYDDVVPFAAMQAAEETLKRNAIPVESYARPNLGHSIDLEGIEAAKVFLKKYLA